MAFPIPPHTPSPTWLDWPAPGATEVNAQTMTQLQQDLIAYVQQVIAAYDAYAQQTFAPHQ